MEIYLHGIDEYADFFRGRGGGSLSVISLNLFFLIPFRNDILLKKKKITSKIEIMRSFNRYEMSVRGSNTDFIAY